MFFVSNHRRLVLKPLFSPGIPAYWSGGFFRSFYIVAISISSICPLQFRREQTCTTPPPRTIIENIGASHSGHNEALVSSV